MAMGKTGTVNISVKMMTDIKDAVSDYRGKANSLKQQLQSEVDGLIDINFVGEAANGFREFYDKNIATVNGEGLDQLLKAIDDIAQGALEAIPGGDGLDDQLGEGNRQ